MQHINIILKSLPFDHKDRGGFVHDGHFMSSDHIFFGMYRNRRRKKYGAGSGTTLADTQGRAGGCHQFFK